MTITQTTLSGSTAASESTLFTALASAASLRTSPRQWVQAKLAEQLTAVNRNSNTSSLYNAIAQQKGLDYFSYSSFDGTSQEALTLWPILSKSGLDFKAAAKAQFQAIADQAQSAVTTLDQGDSSEAPLALRKAATEMYQRMKTLAIMSDLTGGTYTEPRSYHGRAFSA